MTYYVILEDLRYQEEVSIARNVGQYLRVSYWDMIGTLAVI